MVSEDAAREAAKMPEPGEPAAPEPPEIVEVTSRRVACDGGEGPLGHPRVWLAIGEEGFIDCPYCDRRYVLRGDGADH